MIARSLIRQIGPVIGHRGVAALAPENTLAGLRLAHELGAQAVEFDVKLTKDGVPILMHDDRLKRTTNGRGQVARWSIAEIETLDAGAWFGPRFAGERVPRLDAALALAAQKRLGVNIELKPCAGRAMETADRALAVAKEIWPHDCPPPLISSFEPLCLAVARSRCPAWPRGYLCTRPPRNWRQQIEIYDCASLHISNHWIRRQHLEAAKENGILVLVYTVNDPARARSLIAQGVSAIFTDRVDLMIKALSAGSGAINDSGASG